ncbi:MAG TPA: DUF3291 domain-containing protein [Acidimicrobiales bacterium]|nr:DUF3291 domain-containing protein [Acidimicrobiales bacterium]
MILAQVNVGRLVADMDAPEVAEFVGALERINKLADDADGFVWRLSADGVEGELTEVGDGDPRFVINLSTWRSYEAMHEYMYKTEHVDFLRRRREWFEQYPTSVVALWWVEDGEKPTIDDAMARLAHLDEHGPTAFAFTPTRRFDPTGEPVRASQV